MSTRPTMSDVAQQAGVSRQLVSMALRGLDGPSDETRQRILAAAEQIGYRPDRAARLLRGRHSHLLGAMFSMREPFEVDMAEALVGRAHQRGYTMALGPVTPGRSEKEVLDELLSQRIAGLMVLSTAGGSAELGTLPSDIPAVQLGGPSSAERSLPDVRADADAGISALMEHLIDLGHTEITHVTGGTGPNASARRQAYREGMHRHGLTPREVEGDLTEEGGYASAVRLLSDGPPPTALMAANDRAAVGVLAAARDSGLRVPDDISITGFDDSSVASWPFIRLTTARVDPQAMADAAVEALLEQIASEAGRDQSAPRSDTVTVRPELVIRATTSRPNSA
ncbi:LacI family DNA-binding transcriptional regulator [Nesterenkonia sp. K-15-9-6]|uniref:LacI family DNA-binding transcriptional regulator n=1 Tax=Nesterenkonia sp. K-15-9-6 TaxID=3093918 RepID=UPI004043EF5B